MPYDHPMNAQSDRVVQLWQCPSCDVRQRTVGPRAAGRSHPCPNHKGVSVPMQPADRHGIIGERHSVLVIPRGDWVGDEMVHYRGTEAEGTMAVHARRSDGSHDTVVFAPTGYNRAVEAR